MMYYMIKGGAIHFSSLVERDHSLAGSLELIKRRLARSNHETETQSEAAILVGNDTLLASLTKTII